MKTQRNELLKQVELWRRAFYVAVAGICLLLLLLPMTAEAKRLQHETVYAEAWCAMQGGQSEAVNPDGTRTDCLTLGYAIEADFIDKWYEALGQSMHYAGMTDRLPGILFIIETREQCRKVVAAASTIRMTVYRSPRYGVVPIRAWYVGAELCQRSDA